MAPQNQTKFIRNPDGSISEVKEPEVPKGPSLSSLAPGYIVADAIKSGMQAGGEASAASSMAGQAVGSGANGGQLIADGLGGATEMSGGVSIPGIAAGAYTGYQQAKGLQNIAKTQDMSAIQSAALALPTFGLSLAYNPIKKALGFGGSPTNVEEKQREEMAKQGINVDNAGVKEWELNEKFKGSRNEADLTGKDIINSAQLWQLQGYKDADAAKREAIANKALELGIVREHHGTMDFADNADFTKFATEQLAAKEAAKSTGGGDNRQVTAEAKKERKRAQVDQVLSMDAQPTRAPNYGIDLSSIYKNPYL